MPDPAEVLAFQKQAGQLQRVVVAAEQRLQESLDQIGQMKQAVRHAPHAPLELFDEARRLELQLLDLRDRLSGDTTRSERSQAITPSIAGRAQLAYSGALNSPDGPTQTHRQAYQIAAEQFQQLRSQLSPLLDVELVQLKQKLDAAGVPWTAGRLIPPRSGSTASALRERHVGWAQLRSAGPPISSQGWWVGGDGPTYTRFFELTKHYAGPSCRRISATTSVTLSASVSTSMSAMR